MISSTANPMPATATSSLMGLCRSCSQPSGILTTRSPANSRRNGGRSSAMPHGSWETHGRRSRMDDDFDLEVGESDDGLRIVEQDLDFHDASVLAGRRIGSGGVLLADLETDELDDTAQ